MKHSKFFLSLVLFLTILFTGFSQGYHKRIAFIGNSITAGVSLPNATYARDRFSALVDTMLRKDYGDTCIVGNFGVSGRTMLKHGDFPIWNEQFFTDCWQFAPDIFIILLGTNDSKPYNWDPYNSQFFGDYISMIDTFKVRNPQTKFLVCLPPPAYKVVFDIRDSVIKNGVIPLVDSIAKVTGATVVDYYTPLLDSVKLFPDFIHPNEAGHRAMANIVYDKLIESDYIHQVDTGYTFVNHFVSNKLLARDKDSVILSWTTINADTAYFDGQMVPVTGSKKVNAAKTTTYILKAKGKSGEDSLKLTQKFYHQTIAKIVIPSKLTVKVGDTSYVSPKYKDQEGVYITDTSYTVDWSIIEGEGTIYQVEDNPGVYFIGTTAGIAKLTGEVDTVTSNVITVTTKATVDINTKTFNNEDVILYPNPGKGLLNVTILTSASANVKIRIYDIMGVVQAEQIEFLAEQGQHNLVVNTEGLSSGLYLFELEYSGKRYVRKVNFIENK